MSDKPDSIESSKPSKSGHDTRLHSKAWSRQLSNADVRSAATGIAGGLFGGPFGSISPQSQSPAWPSSAYPYGFTDTAATSRSGTAGRKRRPDVEGTEATVVPKRRSGTRPSTGSGQPPYDTDRQADHEPKMEGETATQSIDRMRRPSEGEVSKPTSHRDPSEEGDEISGVTD